MRKIIFNRLQQNVEYLYTGVPSVFVSRLSRFRFHFIQSTPGYTNNRIVY